MRGRSRALRRSTLHQSSSQKRRTPKNTLRVNTPALLTQPRKFPSVLPPSVQPNRLAPCHAMKPTSRPLRSAKNHAHLTIKSHPLSLSLQPEATAIPSSATTNRNPCLLSRSTIRRGSAVAARKSRAPTAARASRSATTSGPAIDACETTIGMAVVAKARRHRRTTTKTTTKRRATATGRRMRATCCCSSSRFWLRFVICTFHLLERQSLHRAPWCSFSRATLPQLPLLTLLLLLQRMLLPTRAEANEERTES
mmetsp:Transcript_12216/g.23929  ORF Transcript_12216/g.23929 Transcript_12216/m.23929 type:complete len:253 (+) Transcript_12216:141-899(+)